MQPVANGPNMSPIWRGWRRIFEPPRGGFEGLLYSNICLYNSNYVHIIPSMGACPQSGFFGNQLSGLVSRFTAAGLRVDNGLRMDGRWWNFPPTDFP